MTLPAELVDTLLCQQLVTRMGNAFDRGDYAAGLAGYAEDAVWHRPDGILDGRAAIAAYYDARPANAVICHVLTNMQVDFPEPGLAVCNYYSQGYREIASGDPRAPQPLTGPGVLWRYHDSLRRTDAGWKVIGRRADQIYQKGA